MSKLSIIFSAALMSLASAASASSVYTYNLLDHADGANTKAHGWLYGLRLDNLNGTGSQQEDHFSISGISGSHGTLVYDAHNMTATLSGTIIQNVSSGTPDAYDVHYTMSNVTDFGDGLFGAFDSVRNVTVGGQQITTKQATISDLVLKVSGTDTVAYSFGNMARSQTGLVFGCVTSSKDLSGKSEARATNLGNDNFTCAGWLAATGTNDWLVTGELASVPLPAGILFAGTGVAAFGLARRRKKKS